MASKTINVNGVTKTPKVTVNARNVGASQHGLKGSLQAEDWGVEEIALPKGRVGMRCGFCAGKGKHRGGVRVGKGGGRKAVIPTRECHKCKVFVCMHLSHYKAGTLLVCCPAH